MKIATWNVNSLKVRLPQVLDWLERTKADALCLQETKLTDERFPVEALAQAGYQAAFAGQPTYNGVAILTRSQSVGAPTAVQIGNPLYPDEQKRLISASVAGVRLVCAYVPNGQSVDSDKYRYKLDWIDALLRWLEPQTGEGHEPLALLGDFNIAPEERDVHDPKLWEGQVLFSEPERERFRALQRLGLVDAFRLFDQPEKSYTWWDYRQMAFRRNRGLRIDHIMVTPSMRERIAGCTIDREMRKLEQPSDHAPVILELR
jgi:exodeoxyribonuclease-3